MILCAFCAVVCDVHVHVYLREGDVKEELPYNIIEMFGILYVALSLVTKLQVVSLECVYGTVWCWATFFKRKLHLVSCYFTEEAAMTTYMRGF